MNRTAIINRLCRRFGNPRYLEIGCGNGRHFANVGSSRKVGVDPVCRGAFQPTFVGESDAFFSLPVGRFDVVFIDGLHHAAQFRRDVEHALARLVPGGVIVCHDVNPATEAMQRVPRTGGAWTGDVWKGWLALRRDRPDLEMFVVDSDHGVGMIRVGKGDDSPAAAGMVAGSSLPRDPTYEEFDRHRRGWLNLVTPETFRDWISRLTVPEYRENADEPKVLIFERTAIDWRGMNRALFLRQWVTGGAVWGKRRRSGYRNLWEGIERWNAYFEIPYFDYRSELNRMARGNWSTAPGVGGVVRDVDLLEGAAMGEDFWILPTDDDDWYAPHLPAMLKALDARRADVVCWHQLRYFPGWNHEEPRHGWRGKVRISEERFESNGYAVRSRLLHTLGRERFRELLYNHLTGRRLPQWGHFRVVDLPAVYAAKNHSPASIMNLRGSADGRFETLARRMAEPLPGLPDGAKWARRWLEEAEMLNARLARAAGAAEPGRTDPDTLIR